MHHWPLRLNGTNFGALLILVATALSAQENSLNMIPELRERAVVMDIVARIVERDEDELWTSQNSKVTIPGRPVQIKLVGQNVVVVVQFTPYRRDDGRQVLVAQGQVWVNMPNEGVQYQSSMQTIPVEYGEQVFFFPLGSQTKAGTARIEIQLALRPYEKEIETEAEAAVDAVDPVEEDTGGATDSE